MRRFDASNAECLVFVYREGLLSAFGHDLKLRVTRFGIEVDELRRAIDARFDAGSLRVLSALRDGEELPEAIGAGDRRQIEENVVHHVLEAARYPEIRFVSSAVHEEGEAFLVEGQLTIRNVERQVTFPVRAAGERWVAEARVHQPDFGIRPFSAMLGALKVRPDVGVRCSVPRG